MPVTAFTFLFGWLAISGIIPFAGFWSKDTILAKTWVYGGALGYSLWAVGVVAALFTAVYMTRQVRLVFYGNERWRAASGDLSLGSAISEEAPDHATPVHETADHIDSGDHGGDHAGGHERLPHESVPLMTFPLVVLAALSLVG